MKKQKISGSELFDQYFSSVYGERWPHLKNAMLHEDTKIARRNRFMDWQTDFLRAPGILSPEKSLNTLFQSKNAEEHYFQLNENFDLNHFSTPLLPFYRLDPASLFPAKALGAQPGERVMDLCAAPGGKSLVIMEDLFKTTPQGTWDLSGEFVANELSPKRRHRMMTVFKRYLPKEVRQRVHIKGMDGSRLGLEQPGSFDRILLDAPCSGERGVLTKTQDLALWKEKRTKSFAIRQYSLLASAFAALKPGGTLVYSTCSISPYENDGVINKLHKRKVNEFTCLPGYPNFGESTEYGTVFLPDENGWGPIYYSVLRKNV